MRYCAQCSPTSPTSLANHINFTGSRLGAPHLSALLTPDQLHQPYLGLSLWACKSVDLQAFKPGRSDVGPVSLCAFRPLSRQAGRQLGLDALEHNTAQHNAIHYNTQALHNSTKQSISVRHITSQYNTAQHNTVHYITLQHRPNTSHSYHTASAGLVHCENQRYLRIGLGKCWYLSYRHALNVWYLRHIILRPARRGLGTLRTRRAHTPS